METPRAGGVHVVDWDGTNANGNRVATGVYFYRLNSGMQAVSRRMVLLK